MLPEGCTNVKHDSPESEKPGWSYRLACLSLGVVEATRVNGTA